MGEEKDNGNKKGWKKIWTLINELLGKSKEREDAFVYTEEGVKRNINEISNEYIDE